MINDYDKKHNRISHLQRSKWTSLEKLNGWKPKGKLRDGLTKTIGYFDKII